MLPLILGSCVGPVEKQVVEPSAPTNEPGLQIRHDYIESAKIARIARFRSAIGHDFSDEIETCRSMKHYFEPRADIEPAGICLFAPVAGRIAYIETEWAGDKVEIESRAWPGYRIQIFHVVLEPGLAEGSTLEAGQALGHHIGPQTMSDIAILDAREGRRWVSYFEHLDAAVMAGYRARGLADSSDAIIPREERERWPLDCVAEHGAFGSIAPEAGAPADWFVFLD